QIVLDLLRNAAAKHAQDPSRCPTALALEEAWIAIDRWFECLLPKGDLPPERLSAIGRVSMLLLDAAEHWPTVFLAQPEDIPETFRKAMQTSIVYASPDLKVSSMVLRPIGISPLTDALEVIRIRQIQFSIDVFVG